MIKRLDDLTRRKLYASENGRCWLCQREATDVAHIIGRAHHVVRWDTAPDGNCHLLCRDCHSKDHDAKLMPSYRDVYVSRFGLEAWQSLWDRSQKWTWMPNTALVDKLKELES